MDNDQSAIIRVPFSHFLIVCLSTRLVKCQKICINIVTEVGLSKYKLDNADISEGGRSDGKLWQICKVPCEALIGQCMNDSEVSGASKAPNVFQVLASQYKKSFSHMLFQVMI